MNNAYDREVLCLLRRTVESGNADHELLQFAAKAAQEMGDFAFAELSLRELEILDSGPESKLLLGRLYLDIGRLTDSEIVYREVIALDPENPVANANLGLILSVTTPSQAEEYLRRAILLLPQNALAHSNLGNFLAASSPTEAEYLYRKAISLDPLSASWRCNLGVLLYDQGRNSDAEEVLRSAVELDPAHSLSRLNLAYLLLSLERFAEGWKLHEARLNERRNDLTFPQWLGEDLSGKSILVRSEQGFGDEIQFCRYAGLLKEMGASRVVLACRPQLFSLLKSLIGVDSIILESEAAEAQCDFWVFALSLPLRFGTTIDTIPKRIPYLLLLDKKYPEFVGSAR